MGSIETPESTSNQTETASKIKASDFDLKGHLGHLDQRQQSAFDEFKSKVQDEIQLEAGQRQWWNDSTLFRYLRARSYNVELAFKQFQSTDQWRKEKKVDELYENFSVEDFEEARKFYPRWTGRRDKIGRPVYVYRIASLAGENTKELYKNDDSKRYDRIICLTEVLDRFIFPLTSDIPSSSNPTPISCVTTIIDLDQLSFKTLWSLRSHLQQSISLNSAHAPETLSTIGIVNAPGFMSTLWNLIKKWFDEGTMKKIHILSKNPGEVLKEIIDENDLPEIYGGRLDWVYESEPDLDSGIREKLGRETLPKGPLIWTEEGVKEVGSGREIKEESQAEETKE